MAIRKDGEGNLWVRGKNAGVFELPRGQAMFRGVDSPFPSTPLRGVPALDSDGRLLFPSSGGLLIRSPAGWRKIDRSGGLRGTVYAAFEDRQQALWIGLAGRGLARWGGYREWESYTAESGLTNDLVYEILPLADGSIWLGTEAGLFRGTRRESGVSWMKVPGVGDFPVHSVRLAPGGDIWIGGLGDFVRGLNPCERRQGGSCRVVWRGAGSGGQGGLHAAV